MESFESGGEVDQLIHVIILKEGKDRLSGYPVVRTPLTWVQSLVGELKSHCQRGATSHWLEPHPTPRHLKKKEGRKKGHGEHVAPSLVGGYQGRLSGVSGNQGAS